LKGSAHFIDTNAIVHASTVIRKHEICPKKERGKKKRRGKKTKSTNPVNQWNGGLIGMVILKGSRGQGKRAGEDRFFSLSTPKTKSIFLFFAYLHFFLHDGLWYGEYHCHDSRITLSGQAN